MTSQSERQAEGNMVATTVLTYTIDQVRPYINWVYFYHAWGLGGNLQEARRQLRAEAEAALNDMSTHGCTRATFGLFAANSDGDDIVVGDVRLPMLRQQQPTAQGEPCLSLADFIRPESTGTPDRIGIFATCTKLAEESSDDGDPYQKMMTQTLADRLAEATAERLHEQVRKHYWGYAPDEQLTMEQLHSEAFCGIRPAVGYPSLPDTSLNFLLDSLIDMRGIGIRLTESGMMIPHASVSGLMLAHPQARYFCIGTVGADQLADYARRRGLPTALVKRFIASHL